MNRKKGILVVIVLAVAVSVPLAVYLMKSGAGQLQPDKAADSTKPAIPKQGTIAPSWQKSDKIAVVNSTPTTMKIKWPAATDDKGVTEYKVFWGYNGGFEQMGAAVKGDLTEAELSGLTPSDYLYLRVEASDADGNFTARTGSLEMYGARTQTAEYNIAVAAGKTAGGELKDVQPAAAHQVKTAPKNGKIDLKSDGKWTYAPNADFTGEDSFESAAAVEGKEIVSKVNLYVFQKPEAKAPQESKYAYPGESGKLVYAPLNDRKDIIPDFSQVGYMGGAATIPDVPVVRTIEPSEADDDRQRIQAAIEEVAKLPLQPNGFRGALLLKKGSYKISDTLKINASGVVLRGEGDGKDGTAIVITAKKQATAIQLAGSGSLQEVKDSRKAITDSYVPVGSRTVNVQDASGFKVGDDIVVFRPGTKEWIEMLGTNKLPQNTKDVLQWKPNEYNFHFERKIIKISGNQITLDIPMVHSLDPKYGGGFVYKYTYPGRIEQSGVEYLRLESAYASDTDENHGWTAVSLSSIQDGWVRNVTAQYFGYSTAVIGGSAKRITVKDSKYLDGKSQITGGRRYPFNVDGQLNLIENAYAETGRHDFVLGSQTLGPNVFYNSKAEKSNDISEPHHRYSVGVLYDNVSVNGKGAFLGVQHRGRSGTGHGWGGANVIFWNTSAPYLIVMSPPGSVNAAIGINNWLYTPDKAAEMNNKIRFVQDNSRENIRFRGIPFIGSGIFDVTDGPVKTASLYAKQLEDRLGIKETAGTFLTPMKESSGALYKFDTSWVHAAGSAKLLLYGKTANDEEQYVEFDVTNEVAGQRNAGQTVTIDAAGFNKDGFRFLPDASTVYLPRLIIAN